MGELPRKEKQNYGHLWKPNFQMSGFCLGQSCAKKGGMKRYRKTERGGGLFSTIEHEQAVAAKTTGILKPRDLIPPG